MVTELCLGTLTMGPVQADVTPEEGGALIRKAVEKGVTFIDTAQGYRANRHVRERISTCTREEIVLASKNHAKTKEEMKEDFERACKEMGTPYIDIFHLHFIHSPEDFKEREGALKALVELRKEGRIKAVGMSAHSIEPFRHIAGNTDIDICFPIFNRESYGINDGTVDEMAEVMETLHAEGKGIYAMKPLGGGHLASDFESALDFVRGYECIDAVSIGMKDERELDLNIAYFTGQPVSEEMKKKAEEVERTLFINRLCKKCGKCIEFCEQGALSLGKEKTEVDTEKCIFCGYCAPVCPEFAIRII